MGPGHLGHYTFLYRTNAFGVKKKGVKKVKKKVLGK